MGFSKRNSALCVALSLVMMMSIGCADQVDDSAIQVTIDDVASNNNKGNEVTEPNVPTDEDTNSDSPDSPDDPSEDSNLINIIPEFFLPAEAENYGQNTPELTLIANQSEQVQGPRDLAFHPFEDRKNELWILNIGTFQLGGSTVTLYNAGQENQEVDFRRDGNAWHFLHTPTALAFSDNGNWATGTGVQDNNHQGGSFAGPSMWSSDMEIYARVGDPPTAQVNGSHLDMLHGSPFSMGVAHERDNAFWFYDGYHRHIVLYDFNEPHYPGGWDHSDGRVHRYMEVEIERHPSVPSHMIKDKESGWLYINDTGNKRIIRMDTNSGEKEHDLELLNEPLEEHLSMHNVTWEVFVDEGLEEPCGIEFVDGRLFVTDYATGHIIAYDVETGTEMARLEVGKGIKGITLGPDNKLWFVNYDSSQVFRLEPR